MKLGKITISPKCQRLLAQLGFYDARKDRFEIPIGLIFIVTLAVTVAALRAIGSLNA